MSVDISPEAVESFCNDLADVADRLDDAGRTGAARAVTDAQAIIRELRSSLTARDSLLTRCLEVLKNDIEAFGPCDHSVGCCMCNEIRLADEVSAILAKGETK